jgi:hypothetical protein
MALLGLAWVGKGVELAEELMEEELDDDGGRGRGTARDVSLCGRGRVRFCCLRTHSPLLLLLLLVLPAAVPSGS